MLVELTEEEVEAFKTIYYEAELIDYLEAEYDEESEECVAIETAFSSLFTKLGIDLEQGHRNV